MPWRISENAEGCDGYAVVKKDGGKVVGCHPTREKANAQLRALYANEGQTAAALGELAAEFLEETGEALVARGMTAYRGQPMSQTEREVREEEDRLNRVARARSPFREELHPRHPAGVREGGRFMVKANAEGRFEVVNPNGKKVAETIEEADAQTFADDANARETNVRIPEHVTTQDIPNAWAVEQGYADWVDAPRVSGNGYSRSFRDAYPGEIKWKPDVDPEVVLVHYLSGNAPENFPVGSPGWDQWMYGRSLPLAGRNAMDGPTWSPRYGGRGISPTKEEREALKRLKGRTKADRQAIARRITATLAACGFVVEGDEPDEALLADAQMFLLDRPVRDGLIAAVAIPENPPRAWFTDPGMERPTPLTVTADGRVYGHLALWDSCHIGEPGGAGVCVAPPRSGSGYTLFHLGEIETAEGELVACGKITLGTGHASLQASRGAAAAHYDNTGAVVADVRAGEDRHGIWVSGALRPGLPETKVRELRAAGISGDWRRYRDSLELVAALAVNVPGFPIPRVAALVAPEMDGDDRLSLVAAGLILEPIPMSALEVNARLDALALLAGAAMPSMVLDGDTSRLIGLD